MATDSRNPDGASGTYVLWELIKDIPLSSDDSSEKAHITCVDAWNGNLYIGTSAGEVLHYVAIPAAPSDPSNEPSYIFATKLEPSYATQQEGRDAGVKQILLLPDAGKACILCNGTATFYTLPELSPAYGGKIQQAGCTWVGGLDLNLVGEEKGNREDPVIIICLESRLRLIRIGREARNIRTIMLEGVSNIQRRGDLACVADSNTYSLLDIVNHRKNDLFPISSMSMPDVERTPPAELPQLHPSGHGRSFSAASPIRRGLTHERNASLGAEPSNSSQWPARSSSQRTFSPAPASSREQSPAKANETPSAEPDTQPPPQRAKSTTLSSNIASLSADEFLLTTGTQMSEPGVGMVVNAEGDPSGGTIEFSSYPESLVLDGFSENEGLSASSASDAEGHVLAIVRKRSSSMVEKGLEIQRWDADSGETQRVQEWLPLGIEATTEDELEQKYCGLRTATSASELTVSEISNSLRSRRLILSGEPTEADAQREQEEDKFAARFAQIQASVLLYTSDRVSWITRNPLILRLERQLSAATRRPKSSEISVDVPGVRSVVNSIRGQDACNELEFLTLTYIRQKASLFLFGNLLLQTASGFVSYERDKRFAEEALVDGDIDPRVILSLVPPLSNEVKQGEHGIWIPQGLRDTVEMLRSSFESDNLVLDPHGAYGDNLLAIIKRYLFIWRKKKGFGSVADEAYVFQTVDAALLHLLLVLDQSTPRGPAIAGSVRVELNEVVDKGVDCFDRAVELFEQFHRLYMLSRLYQKRKMVAQVLATWKRILEGEQDAGGELIEGEHVLRRYLTKIHNRSLVQEYGAWLANRDAKLGVQVFADDTAHVKFEPSEAVAILKEQASGAVKDYLEHLVFDKNHVQYVNDLIAFYLDGVINELETSDGAKNTLLQSYQTYRALRPPKPTYQQFITDNAIDAEWVRNRLRLLQLIGGSHGAASKYDVHTLRERLAPHSEELVPEMIILNGREGKHEEALRLLTHGLGDYDTAIRYCLLGGSSIFHPGSALAPEQPIPSKQEQARLFEYLLHEFFKIEDLGERLERTSELLERFGGWFDIASVLDLIPEAWSVELVSGFLIHGFRRLIHERNETTIMKALASAQNLKKNVDLIEKTEALGPTVVNTDSTLEVG